MQIESMVRLLVAAESATAPHALSTQIVATKKVKKRGAQLGIGLDGRGTPFREGMGAPMIKRAFHFLPVMCVVNMI